MNNNIIMDFSRKERCGVEEAVFCESKSVQQINEIVNLAIGNSCNLLLTRLNPEKFNKLDENLVEQLTYDNWGRTAYLGDILKAEDSYDNYSVAIVSGGASDHAVCKEVETTLLYHGVKCRRFEDIGVAALWRLSERLDDIKKADVIIAVAGMEAAMATVLSGMVSNPIIAVPTSVGYGVGQGGMLALHSCLGSCASGLMTVNIDNGFGAACAAIKILRQFTCKL